MSERKKSIKFCPNFSVKPMVQFAVIFSIQEFAFAIGDGFRFVKMADY
jgi:hypothetical protein